MALELELFESTKKEEKQKMKIKSEELKFIICGQTVVGEYKFSFAGIEIVTAGKAVCDKEDVFNLAIGRKLAYKRAKAKAIKIFKSMLKHYQKYIAQQLCEIFNEFEYLEKENSYIQDSLFNFKD